MSDRPMLEVENLVKSFGALVATDHVTFDVRPGETHAIIGPNGAGKSTLFNLMSGRFAPTQGSIRLEGREVAGERPYRIARRGGPDIACRSEAAHARCE